MAIEQNTFNLQKTFHAKGKPDAGDLPFQEITRNGDILSLFMGFLVMALGEDSPLFSLLAGLSGNMGRQEGDAVYIKRHPDAPHSSGKSVDLSRFSLEDDFPEDIKFIKAERSGNSIIYTGENGEEVIKHRKNTTEASRSWVNNNPGNLEYGDFAKSRGAIGTDGRFAIFPSPESGMKAQASLLQSGNYKNLTIEQAIHRYAPSHENNTNRYVSIIANAAGVDKSTKMSDLKPGQMINVVKAMAKHEGWKEGSILQDIKVAEKTTPAATSDDNIPKPLMTADASNIVTEKPAAPAIPAL
ncbi:MAG: hypothetical protein CO093_03845 [Alphaproteobacteria bacterium CG_4_9_14_3_um_filter_47_13]|nr:MAG: hypothetical protein CO093_03845 [Alphaproteobacteria bacterium CG_4_9_14_3_um_filter_47_13]